MRGSFCKRVWREQRGQRKQPDGTETAATADLRPDAKHSPGRSGWGWRVQPGGKADFHTVSPQNTLSPAGSCSFADPCPPKTPRAAIRHPQHPPPRKPRLYCVGSLPVSKSHKVGVTRSTQITEKSSVKIVLKVTVTH